MTLINWVMSTVPSIAWMPLATEIIPLLFLRYSTTFVVDLLYWSWSEIFWRSLWTPKITFFVIYPALALAHSAPYSWRRERGRERSRQGRMIRSEGRRHLPTPRAMVASSFASGTVIAVDEQKYITFKWFFRKSFWSSLNGLVYILSA